MLSLPKHDDAGNHAKNRDCIRLGQVFHFSIINERISQNARPKILKRKT